MDGVRIAMPRGPRRMPLGKSRRLRAPETSSRIEVAYLHVISSFLESVRRLELSDAERCRLSEQLRSQLSVLAGNPGWQSASSSR